MTSPARRVAWILGGLAAAGVVAFVLVETRQTVPDGPTSADKASSRAVHPADSLRTVSLEVARPAYTVEDGTGVADDNRESADAPGVVTPPTFATITGFVRESDDRPAAGLRVDVMRRGAREPLVSSERTDASGRFEIRFEVTKKKTVRVRISGEGRPPIVVPGVAGRPNQSIELGVLRFLPTASLEVRVRDEENRPVPSAIVTVDLGAARGIRHDEGGESPYVLDTLRCQRTDEDGIARLASLPSGEVVVDASKPSRLPYPDSFRSMADGPIVARRLNLSPGHTERIELVVNRLATLRGRAVVSGVPLRSEWISIWEKWSPNNVALLHARVRTDESGNFESPPLPPTRYVLIRGDPGPSWIEAETQPDEFGPAQLGRRRERETTVASAGSCDDERAWDAQPGSAWLDVDFGGTRLEVLVLDEADHRPIVGAIVFASRLVEGQHDTDICNSSFRAKTDFRGIAIFEGLRRAVFRVAAKRPEGPVAGPVDVATGDPSLTAECVVRLAPAADIRGTIRDEHGAPIAGARVGALPTSAEVMAGEKSAPLARTDSRGAFVLSGLAVGARRIVALAEEFRTQSREIVGPSESCDFALEKTGRVRVSLRRAGNPEATCRVTLKFSSAAMSEREEFPVSLHESRTVYVGRFVDLKTDDAGTAVLYGVPKGEWTITARSDREGADDVTARVIVAAGKETRTTLDLPE